jgi:hypothetical protein
VTAGLLLIRRLRPIGEPAGLRPIGRSGASTLDGTAGAGRIVHAVAEAGIRCDSVSQVVVAPHIQVANVRELDLGRRFDTVVLGSHLINLPDDASRWAFIALATRHVVARGTVLIEHHPIDWAETAADVEPTPGSGVGMENVRRAPPFVSAVSVYDIGGRMVRQPFNARVLSERDLAEVLERTGLRPSRRLGPTLIEARPRD